MPTLTPLSELLTVNAGPAIKEWRLENGRYAKEMAAIAKVDEATYKQYENGRNVLTAPQQSHLLAEIGVGNATEFVARYIALAKSAITEKAPYSELNDPCVLGPIARKWRNYNGWSQAEIAEKISVSNHQYMNFEKGRKRNSISAKRLPAVISALECVSAEDLAAQGVALPGDIDKAILGPAIKHVREHAAISQKALAFNAGIEIRVLGNFECGVNNMPGRAIDHIVHSLGYASREDLMEEEKTMREGLKSVDMREFAIALKKHRFAHRPTLSQEAVAQRIGMSYYTINRVENLKFEIRTAILVLIPPIFGCSSPQDMIEKAKDLPEPPLGAKVKSKTKLAQAQGWAVSTGKSNDSGKER